MLLTSSPIENEQHVVEIELSREIFPGVLWCVSTLKMLPTSACFAVCINLRKHILM